MRKVYYIYNPQTQTYDRIYPTVRQRMVSLLRRLFIGMGLGAGSFIILLIIFGSPSEKELRKENSQLLAQYNVLSRRLDEAMGVLQDVQQRDDNLYRVIITLMITCIGLYLRLTLYLRLFVRQGMAALTAMNT